MRILYAGNDDWCSRILTLMDCPRLYSYHYIIHEWKPEWLAAISATGIRPPSKKFNGTWGNTTHDKRRVKAILAHAKQTEDSCE